MRKSIEFDVEEGARETSSLLSSSQADVLHILGGQKFNLPNADSTLLQRQTKGSIRWMNLLMEISWGLSIKERGVFALNKQLINKLILW